MLIRSVLLLLQLLWFAGPGGRACARDIWRSPTFALPASNASSRDDLSEVERIYAYAIELQDRADESCVDFFFAAARLTINADGVPIQTGDQRVGRARQLHQSSLQKLVITGQQYGRLDPRSGLTVIQCGKVVRIPIRHRGFVWQAEDFDFLSAVGDYQTAKLSKYYARPGVGIPLVVSSCRRQDRSFRPRESVFAATMRLEDSQQPDPITDMCSQHFNWSRQTLAIALYDPLRVDTVQVGAMPCPIAKDLSAPIVYRVSTRQGGVFEGFLQPFATGPRLGISGARLYTLEPYQPGKIPVVFIHGLLSDRFTWAEMVNELKARPGFDERFQIWVFEYPTGRTFLGSAAELRSQLETMCRRFDPCGRDPQLSNVILAAHSMGGLVAKMQITSSGDLLWRSVADRTFDQVSMTPMTRQRLAETFFFDPSPRISRVVYFATPHRGSEFAARLIGRIGSACVEEPENEVRMHRMLITANPDVFAREVRRRIPTSLDLLEPQSKLLQASDRLPIRCGVVTHSIIGAHCWTLSLGRSDGVVSVESARDRNATTERLVEATHSRVKSAPEAVEEFLAILKWHRGSGIGLEP